MAVVITNTVAQALATALETAIDAGTAAVIEIRTGAAPGPEAAAGGTLLATLVCSGTFGTVGDANPGGRITAGAITSDASADNTGTAAHFRLLTQSGGTAILEGSVGTSGADMNFNTVAFTAGSVIALSAMTITMPES